MWAQGSPLLGKYLFGSNGGGGPGPGRGWRPLLTGGEGRGRTGSRPQPSPDCSVLQLGAGGPWGSASCVFMETKSEKGVPATRRARCRRPGYSPGREPRSLPPSSLQPQLLPRVSQARLDFVSNAQAKSLGGGQAGPGP